MTWTVQIDRDTGEITVLDPSGATVVDEMTGPSPPTVEADALGVPTKPDVRAAAAGHIVDEVQASNITIATAVEWSMDRFEVIN